MIKERKKLKLLTYTLKVLCFCNMFLILFFCITKILVNPETNMDLRHYQWIRGFFAEPADSLDAVFIGASHVYSSWVPAIAWKKYGIKIWPLTSAALGGDYIKSIIENIRLLHKDALYIVCMNSFLYHTYWPGIHRLSDYWPKLYRLKMIFNQYSDGLVESSDITEYIAPLMRFHDRWNQLLKEDFHYKIDGMKGGSSYELFLDGAKDVSTTFYDTSKRKEIDQEALATLYEFLLYCEKNSIRVLFVGSPWCVSEDEKAMVNYVEDAILSKGFVVINLQNYLDEIGLRPEKDYYDDYHTNIHGALKITDYLAQYLLDNYTFPEKTGGGTRAGTKPMNSIVKLYART